MLRIPTDRIPTHLGEMLLEEYLKPLGLTQRELAAAIYVSYQQVKALMNGRRSITPSIALRSGKYFDVSPAFWMNLQLRWDLYHAIRSEAQELEAIELCDRVCKVRGIT